VNTALVTCPRCAGTGRYTAPTRYGPDCFRCNGTGRCRPSRQSAYKAPETPDYVPLEPYIVSDQTREYFGIKINRLQIRSAELAWERGCREIRNPNKENPNGLSLYR